MTDKKRFKDVSRSPISLRVRFVAIFFFAVAFSVLGFFAVKTISGEFINKVYLSDENKAKREAEYHESLQQYIDEKGITFENIDRVSEWQKKNQYVYLMIYKEQTDDEALFIPDDLENNTQSPGADDSGKPLPDGSGDASEDSLPTPDGENGGNSADSGEDGEGDVPGGAIGGITIDLPTKSELQEAAKKLDMLFIELPENQYVYAKFAEFTEYLYYDITNIVSIIFAAIVALVILLLYITHLTVRISKLGVAVNRVAEGDTESKIILEGADEISELASNVETMRSTMVENYKREKEALDSNTELITSISHDIRTPLTVLLGYIDVMRTNSKDNEQMQEYINAAENTAMRLKKLSDDMFGYFLVFGRNERDINSEVYEVGTLFEQMLSEHILLMNESGFSAELDFDGDSLNGKNIKTDAPSLVRIFDNLFSNIYKYADSSATVKIRVYSENGMTRVTFSNLIRRGGEVVESNGIGLKTCKKLAEYIDAQFEYYEKDGSFITNLSFAECE